MSPHSPDVSEPILPRFSVEVRNYFQLSVIHDLMVVIKKKIKKKESIYKTINRIVSIVMSAVLTYLHHLSASVRART